MQIKRTGKDKEIYVQVGPLEVIFEDTRTALITVGVAVVLVASLLSLVF